MTSVDAERIVDDTKTMAESAMYRYHPEFGLDILFLLQKRFAPPAYTYMHKG